MRKFFRRNVLYLGFVILLIGFLVLMYRGGVGTKSRDSERLQTTAELQYLESKNQRDEAATKKALRIESDRLYQEMLDRHPEMKVTYKDVADEDNGFLQWLNFMDRCSSDDGLPMPENIAKMISGMGVWDAAEFEEWLDQNRELYEEILALGLLPDQSAKGIDISRIGDFVAKIPKQSSDLLLAAARLAISKGDTETAQLCVRSVLGTARHLEGIETPGLFLGTVSLLLKVGAEFAIVECLTEAEHTTPEILSDWRRLAARESAGGDMLGHYLLGEFHVGSREYLIPELLKQQSSQEGFPGSLNPETMLDAYAEYFSGVISKLKGKTIKEVGSTHTSGFSIEDIPEEHRIWLDDFPSSFSAWTTSWIDGQRINGLIDASFAVALGEELPIEPVSGLPYVLSRDAGTLSLPKNSRFPDMEKTVKIPGYGR